MDRTESTIKFYKCVNCKFYQQGNCHRFPPIHNGDWAFCFPKVDEYDWCGEFQPKK